MANVLPERKDSYHVAMDALIEIAQDKATQVEVRIEACKLLLEKCNLRR